MEIMKILKALEQPSLDLIAEKMGSEFADAVSSAMTLLVSQGERIAELEEQHQWIPVTERLPELIPCDAGTAYSEAVNVLTEGRKVLTAVWNGKWFICDEEFWEAWGEKITHWTPVLLPLPELPKEKNAQI